MAASASMNTTSPHGQGPLQLSEISTTEHSQFTKTFDKDNFIHSPPIYRISKDILWTCFMLNADTFTQDPSCHALNISQRTSQVCREWRQIILGSPSIWGRLFDLDHSFFKSDHWQAEILRRSGAAPLWISGLVTSRTQDYLVFIFKNHWARIQKVNLECLLVSDPARFASIKDVLELPAPILQVFRISQWPDRLLSDSPLFANRAPSLQVFNAGQITFSLCAPWIPNLREIRISHDHNFTLFETFNALRKMPLLEHLHLEHLHLQPVKNDPSDEPLRLIHLPRLTTLRVENMSICIWRLILELVMPRPECSLFIVTGKELPQHEPDDITLRAAHHQLSRYMRGCCNVETSAYFAMDCKNEFNLSIYDHLDNQTFAITLGDYSTLTKLLITDISSSSFFSAVEQAVFVVSQPPSTIHPEIISFLASLHSVKVLTTSPSTLKFILEIARDKPCPVLHTLKVLNTHKLGRGLPFSEFLVQPTQLVIKAFVQHREKVGLPLATLDLADFPIQMLSYLDFLETTSGLVVIVGQLTSTKFIQYECGSQNLSDFISTWGSYH